MTAELEFDRVFQAIGDPTRRAMIGRLAQGPQSVSRLADSLGVTLTAVGQHLQVLEDAGFAHTRKQGRVRTCSLAIGGFRAVERWIAFHRTTWEQRLDALGEALAEDD